MAMIPEDCTKLSAIINRYCTTAIVYPRNFSSETTVQ